MHSLVRRYLKTAILFLAAGLAIGLWMIVGREFRGQPPAPYLVSAHTHAILVGFVMMMILGVALWLFPRPSASDTRYRPGLAEAAYWLVTTGTVLRTACEILHTWPALADRGLAPLIALGAILQVTGFAVFFYAMWARIRPAGSREREARGERF